MGRSGKSRLRSSGLRAAADDLGRGQKLRAAAGQRAALAGTLSENLLTRGRDPPRFAPLVLLQRHVCQVLLKLNLLLRRGIRGVGRLDGGIHGVGIRLYLSVHFVDVPDLIIEVRGLKATK